MMRYKVGIALLALALSACQSPQPFPTSLEAGLEQIETTSPTCVDTSGPVEEGITQIRNCVGPYPLSLVDSAIEAKCAVSFDILPDGTVYSQTSFCNVGRDASWLGALGSLSPFEQSVSKAMFEASALKASRSFLFKMEGVMAVQGRRNVLAPTEFSLTGGSADAPNVDNIPSGGPGLRIKSN